MQVQKEFNEESGFFFIEEGNERLAEMRIRKRGEDRILIEHTEVSEKLKGKGVGKLLVDYAVTFARENRLKIVPLCPYAKSVLTKFKEYEDVL